MKSYVAILKARFAALFQYRAAALAGMCTQVFWGFILIMIMQAFYSESQGPEPLTLTQTITYIWLVQAFLQFVPWNTDKELEAQVKTGNVAYELVRPLDLYWHWFARLLALRLAPTMVRCIPLFTLAILFFGMSAPVSKEAGFVFIASILLSALLSAAITTLLTISLFWTISGEGIQRLTPHLSVFLMGLIVPLPLFPDWMQPFLNIQPFRAILDIPIRLYTGVIADADAPYYLAFQLFWIAAFVWGGRHFMNKALRRIELQGG